jgi:hypothetical protein
MYNNDALKVLTGESRLSYCHLDKPYASKQGGEPKYNVTLLIPKSDIACKADIDSSIQAAINEGISKTWGGKRPAAPAVPIWDGDGTRKNGEPFGAECRGHWVITASSKDKPQVVHISNIRVELAPHDVYSGMYGRATIRFFTYDNSGNRGVGCGLGNILKTRDGEPLAAGRSEAADDFANLEQTAPPAGYGYPPQQAYPAYAPQPAYPQQPVYQPPVTYQQPAPSYAPAQQPPWVPSGAINPITGQPM